LAQALLAAAPRPARGRPSPGRGYARLGGRQMGAQLDVLTSCDGRCGTDAGARRPAQSSSNRPRRAGPPSCADDPAVGCAALEDAAHQALADANRGGVRISDDVMLNHELLQYARQGDVKGLGAALDKGAWTETRRPLVMKPQKPDGESKGYQSQLGKTGMTALMFAAQNGSADCVRRLLWAGAEVNATEEDGWTPLHFAAKEGHLEVCTLLLQSRADAEAANGDDRSPLQAAQEEDGKFAERLRSLIAKGKVVA